MFFRILKKDLKRKKVMNAILLSFILLATMFVASGISNVVSVMNDLIEKKDYRSNRFIIAA